ncbi:MAG TPA: hypothetical protein VGI81_22950 [Tepidisphaeraceae bacterium]
MEDYARQLIEDGLSLEREAESMTIAEIMAPVRKAAGAVDEAEIVRLVEAARNDHHGCKPARGRRRKGIVMASHVFDEMADRIERLKTAISIRRGLEDVAAGQTRPARQTIEGLAAELGLKLDQDLT